jgi:hypothetical protein
MRNGVQALEAQRTGLSHLVELLRKDYEDLKIIVDGLRSMAGAASRSSTDADAAKSSKTALAIAMSSHSDRHAASAAYPSTPGYGGPSSLFMPQSGYGGGYGVGGGYGAPTYASTFTAPAASPFFLR